MQNWFNVDKKGLAQLLERKGKEFVLFELVQNAWDEQTTMVDVMLERIAGTRQVRIVVSDDNPEGFRNLSHAFTLFAESAKKGDAEKRGRFNLGEKLVLALCDEATITSTTGTIVFNADGRSTRRTKTEAGSVFTGIMRMTNEEIERCNEAMRTLLCPESMRTFYNSDQLKPRKALKYVEHTLPTEIADEEGNLRRTERKTIVEIFEPLPGETAMLYELGIPVVATDDRWHINVHQKVPLTFDRENVPPSYLAKVRALAVEQMRNQLTRDDANATWVKDAFARYGDDLSDETVKTLTTLRFGDKAVIFDPSDPEANNIAASKGYTLVSGGAMSGVEWDRVKSVGALRPAGQVTPSPKPFSDDGEPLKTIDEANWTPLMRSMVAYFKRMGTELLGGKISVEIANDPQWGFSGAFGSRRLIVNLGRLGHKWFAGPLEPINDFMLHEFAHHYEKNHLSENYYRALTRLGAQLTGVALAKPELFNRI